MYRTDFWTLGEGEGGVFQENSIETCILSRVKQITSPGWMMRQVLGPGALGRPRGIGWRGRWEGGSGWGIHVKPWLILVNVWQKLLQYCKVISLQLIKINYIQKNKKIKINLLLKTYNYLKTCLATHTCPPPSTECLISALTLHFFQGMVEVSNCSST